MSANCLRIGKNETSLVGVVQAPTIAIFNRKWHIAPISAPCTPRPSIETSCRVILDCRVISGHAESLGTKVKTGKRYDVVESDAHGLLLPCGYTVSYDISFSTASQYPMAFPYPPTSS